MSFQPPPPAKSTQDELLRIDDSLANRPTMDRVPDQPLTRNQYMASILGVMGGTAGVTSLAALTDTAITEPTAGQVLVRNMDDLWENVDASTLGITENEFDFEALWNDSTDATIVWLRDTLYDLNQFVIEAGEFFKDPLGTAGKILDEIFAPVSETDSTPMILNSLYDNAEEFASGTLEYLVDGYDYDDDLDDSPPLNILHNTVSAIVYGITHTTNIFAKGILEYLVDGYTYNDDGNIITNTAAAALHAIFTNVPLFFAELFKDTSDTDDTPRVVTYLFDNGEIFLEGLLEYMVPGFDYKRSPMDGPDHTPLSNTFGAIIQAIDNTGFLAWVRQYVWDPINATIDSFTNLSTDAFTVADAGGVIETIIDTFGRVGSNVRTAVLQALRTAGEILNDDNPPAKLLGYLSRNAENLAEFVIEGLVPSYNYDRTVSGIPNDATGASRRIFFNAAEAFYVALGDAGTWLKAFTNAAGDALDDLSDWLENAGEDASSAVNDARNTVLGGLQALVGVFVGEPNANAETGDTFDVIPTGDLNLSTYDIVNVDRIFFSTTNRDEGSITNIDFNNRRAHLACYHGLSYYHVPDTIDGSQHLFYRGADMLFRLRDDRIEARKKILLNPDLTDSNPTTQAALIAAAKPTGIGEIGRDGDDLVVWTSAGVKNFKDIGSASSGFTPLTAQQSGAFWLPVYRGGRSKPTTATLNEQFGTRQGTVGIYVYEYDDSADSTDRPDSDEVVFVWKTFGAWLGIELSGVATTPTNYMTTGKRHTVLTYEKRSAPVYLQPSNPVPTDGAISNATTGQWGVAGQSGDADDGSLWIYEVSGSSQNIVFSRENEDFNNNNSSGNANPALPSIMPTLTSGNPSQSGLDRVLGVDDGYVGFNTSQNRFYIKVAGRWYYRQMLT